MKTFKSKLREVTAVYKTTCPLQNVRITNSKDVNEVIRKIYPVEINIREAMVVLYLSYHGLDHEVILYSLNHP